MFGGALDAEKVFVSPPLLGITPACVFIFSSTASSSRKPSLTTPAPQTLPGTSSGHPQSFSHQGSDLSGLRGLVTCILSCTTHAGRQPRPSVLLQLHRSQILIGTSSALAPLLQRLGGVREPSHILPSSPPTSRPTGGKAETDRAHPE